MSYQSPIFVVLLVCSLLSACSFNQDSKVYPNNLREAFEDHFDLGVALSSQTLATDHTALVITKRHFNTITSENSFKWERINPSPGIYQLDEPTNFIKFGENNRLNMVGHTLFWHSQTPDWVFEDQNGGLISREQLLQRMRDRAQMMADHFGHSIKIWDVVNEAILDNGNLRPSKYHQIIGEDFIEQAFIIAEEALPPDSELIYNDYNMHIPEKRDALIAVVNKLRARNIKIDGIGMQGHWEMRTPLVAQIEKSIIQFANSNIPIHITELDIDYLGREEFFGVGANVDITKNVATLENNPYPKGDFPPAVDSALSNRYLDIFEVLLKHSAAIRRVSFWGVTDRGSWLNDWPVIGRTNYPLLFDRNGKAKPVVKQLIKLATEQPKTTLKSAYKEKFLVGGGLDDVHLKNIRKHPSLNIVKTHFNTITSTNALKWESINPEPGVYTPELADAFVNFGKENKLKIVGHTLFWHQQTPKWVFEDNDGNEVSKEVLLQRMRTHVRYLSERYGDSITEWDVVNEAFESNGEVRSTHYGKILGPDFLMHAFKIANEELPESTKLIYNDYEPENWKKLYSIISELRAIRSANYRVDGVGIQAHWEHDRPSIWRAHLALTALKLFEFPVYITELDLDFLGRWWFYQLNWNEKSTVLANIDNNPYPSGVLPAEAQERFNLRYQNIFDLYSKHSSNIERVSFWGITDADSWLNDWPVEDRKNYSLLFDRDDRPKSVVDNIIASPQTHIQ